MTFADLFKQASSVSKTVNANWSNLMDYANHKDSIAEMIQSPLDRTLRAMTENLSSQAFVIDEKGILGRKQDESTDKLYSPEQMRIVNNVIMFTNDDWKTSSTALGKVVVGEDNNGNPIYKYGLAADVLIGNLLLGKNMAIKNANSTISLDDSGITIKKIKKIDEENESETEIVFKADTDGNVFLKGKIEATSGKIGGYTIGEKDLVGTTVGMSSDDGENAIAFWAGAKSSDEKDKESALYKVLSNGALIASEATIIGNVQSSQGGTFGKFDFIDDGFIANDGAVVMDTNNNSFILSSENSLISSAQIQCKKILCKGGDNEINLDYRFEEEEAVIIPVNITVEKEEGKTTYKLVVKAETAFIEDIDLEVTVNYVASFWTIAHGDETRTRTQTCIFLFKAGEKRAEITGFPSTCGKYNAGIFGTHTYEISTEPRRWNITQHKTISKPAISVKGNLIPNSSTNDEKYNLGSEDMRWGKLYMLAPNNGSDRKIKKDIRDLSEEFSYNLIKGLNPRMYKFKDFKTPRDRAGFIAQEVEELLLKLGMTTEDFALVSKSLQNEPDSENNHYSIEYNNLIAPLVKVVQSILLRLEELERTFIKSKT